MLEPEAGSNTPLVKVPLLLALVMVKSAGSSNHSPLWPLPADAPTRAPVTSNERLPDVSTNPPLPPCSPPLAEMLP